MPTVIIKNEDREPLKQWQVASGVPIHVWHVFFDLSFGLSFDESERLVDEGLVEPTKHVYQAPGGATTEKVIFRHPYQYAYAVAETVEQPTLSGKYIEDKNGHILPYVQFEGGRLVLQQSATHILTELADR